MFDKILEDRYNNTTKCLYCNNEFTPSNYHRTTQKYCSAKCRNKSKVNITIYKNECQCCGKEFTTSKYSSSKQKYCSKECRDKAYCKQWRKDNKEKYLEYQRQWKIDNPNYFKELT
jgi:hypothetical protein